MSTATIEEGVVHTVPPDIKAALLSNAGLLKKMEQAYPACPQRMDMLDNYCKAGINQKRACGKIKRRNFGRKEKALLLAGLSA